MSGSKGVLRIAPDLALPIEAVTETFAILAKRGKGKTNTAVVMAEEMIGAGMPVVVIDPIGVWWGIRSNSDGTGDGLPFVIFGGDHADVPLQETAGELVADVIIEQRIPAVIDLSGFSKSASRRFMAPFIERLYHRNREALHVIVDEADAFAPQRAQAEGLRLLGAMEDLVRRGRARGIGVTLITQRPAVLHKDVLTQAEVLIALGMTGPRDVAAIDEWVKLHADEDLAKEVKASLPSLPVGTAWVWSPGWLDILQKVQIRARTTFDSSATPKPGQKRILPKRMTQVDLAALGEQIATTVEKAKADDPKRLRTEVARLERELAAERAKPVPAPEVERVQFPILDADWREAWAEDVNRLLERFDELAKRLDQYPTQLPTEGNQGQPTTRRSAPRATSTSSTTGRAPVAGSSTPQKPRPSETRETRPTVTDGRALSKAERKILSVLAQQGIRSTTQVAILTGYSHKSGGYRNALSTLRTAGYIDGRGTIAITDPGLDALGEYEPLPTGLDLLDWWKDNHLSKAEKAIVDVLVDHGGGPVDVATIADAAGYSASSGGYRNALSRLRSLEIASGRGELVLNPELLEESSR